MPCHCKKFSPKGKAPPKAKPKAGAPLNKGLAGMLRATGVKAKIPQAKKVPPKKMTPRVAAAHKAQAKALAKANANPCHCTP
jgi:hypothetical protein